MKALTSAFIIILVVSAFDSCYYDNEEFLYGDEAACTDTVSSYNGRLKGIIDNLCIDCHSPGGDSPTLTDFSSVSSNRDAIICRVVDSPTCGNVMPKNRVIDPCDKQAFELWQQNGFRE
jgi:hypothetical protein